MSSQYIEGLVRGVYIFYAVGLFAGVSRIAIRSYIMRRPGLEEIIMGVSMLFWTADVLLSVVILRRGTNQMTPAERAAITPEEIHTRTIGSKAIITAWFCYITFIWGAKTCLLLFYRKLMHRVKQVRMIKLAAVVLVVTYTAVMLSMFLVCRPFHKNWQVVPDPGPQCTDGYYYVWIIGISNIFTDGLLIAIPLPVVVQLQISKTQKALLVLLFGSGIFVMVATALRIHFTIGGDIANLTFWCMIETTSAMLVVNAPGIVSLYGHITTRSRSHGSYELRDSGGRQDSKTRPGLANIGGKYEGQNISTCSRAVDGESLDARKPQPDSYIGPGESRERIIAEATQQDSSSAEGELVIHQSITYTVTTEFAGSSEGQPMERSGCSRSDLERSHSGRSTQRSTNSMDRVPV